jgi:hypothetical protein
MKLFLAHHILPKIVYIPWMISWGVLSFLSFLQFFTSLFGEKKIKNRQIKICIEAGENGWQSIELQELYQSAIEYLGIDNVKKLSIPLDENYLRSVKNFLHTNEITHYVYDPRTGDQGVLRGLFQSFAITILLFRNYITPISILTDLSIRAWRAQSAIVTSKKGLVVSLMSPRMMKPIYPHTRLVGPCLMPLSQKTNNSLNKLISAKTVNSNPTSIFSGSLYEPRTAILNEIQKIVAQRGKIFEIAGRGIGKKKAPKEDYWNRLVTSDIVLTTAVQMSQKGTDWAEIPHFLYRYLEVLASGSFLIAEEVPGIRKYFIPDQHFVSFLGPEDAADKIDFYTDNPVERKRIAAAGKKKADELINARFYWASIDIALKHEGLHN